MVDIYSNSTQYLETLFTAVTHLNFQQIVPPVLQSFSDHDSRVRYYACEALYNIAKVSRLFLLYLKLYSCVELTFYSFFFQVVRGEFIVFFNQIFDALCKLSADSAANVQSAAHLLDRLVKVIVLSSLFNTKDTHLNLECGN